MEKILKIGNNIYVLARSTKSIPVACMYIFHYIYTARPYIF